MKGTKITHETIVRDVVLPNNKKLTNFTTDTNKNKFVAENPASFEKTGLTVLLSKESYVRNELQSCNRNIWKPVPRQLPRLCPGLTGQSKLEN